MQRSGEDGHCVPSNMTRVPAGTGTALIAGGRLLSTRSGGPSRVLSRPQPNASGTANTSASVDLAVRIRKCPSTACARTVTALEFARGGAQPRREGAARRSRFLSAALGATRTVAERRSRRRRARGDNDAGPTYDPCASCPPQDAAGSAGQRAAASPGVRRWAPPFADRAGLGTAADEGRRSVLHRLRSVAG